MWWCNTKYKLCKAYDIYEKLTEAKGSDDLTVFCKKVGLPYKSTAAFKEAMEGISPELRESVVFSRGGAKENFTEILIEKLGITPNLLTEKLQFPIPLTFARALYKLDKANQVELVKRWREGDIEVNLENLEQLLRSMDDGFELAFENVFARGKKSFVTEQSVFLLIGIDPISVGELVSLGYDQVDVERTLKILVKSGLVSQQGGKYELTDAAAELYGKVWNSLPDTALATWISRTLTAMGALRIDSDKAKYKRIIGYIQSHLNNYSKELDKPASIGMIRALGQRTPRRSTKRK